MQFAENVVDLKNRWAYMSINNDSGGAADGGDGSSPSFGFRETLSGFQGFAGSRFTWTIRFVSSLTIEYRRKRNVVGRGRVDLEAFCGLVATSGLRDAAVQGVFRDVLCRDPYETLADTF